MEDARLTEGVSRRTLVKGAAWSLPVIAVAAATPLAAASTGTVEGFAVEGTCGLLGALGPGFTVKAGTTPIPVGTTILVQTSGVLALNLISLSGQGLAELNLLSNKQIAITLTAPIPAGSQLNIQWLLSVTVLTTTSATLTLPTGYTAGAGTKSLGSLRQTLILCTPS
ncbi:hypothetical protein J2Y69_001856 [Microbacterium resistens]|uniref:Secreted protein n=1 Tax=Microbacterium resistens TaxID=156977 RepID=A0ABU1SCC7_9MICO|nr:hypothetical protein [Microbacterium resistens]MDR6867255.1 hypothetical protein [Microbacterium resistens]